MALADGIELQTFLVEGQDIDAAQVKLVLAKKAIGDLQKAATAVRKQSKSMVEQLHWVEVSLLPFLEKVGCGVEKLREQHATAKAQRAGIEDHSGVKVGRCLGNLAALQLLFDSDGVCEESGKLAARLITAFESPQKSIAKMTADAKLVQGLRAFEQQCADAG